MERVLAPLSLGPGVEKIRQDRSPSTCDASLSNLFSIEVLAVNFRLAVLKYTSPCCTTLLLHLLVFVRKVKRRNSNQDIGGINLVCYMINIYKAIKAEND